ncbi:flagellar biosynthesis regulator FlaF [Azospirillum fermentarium]|uniref:DUF2934 domain-containing protein n=1 Tax=Azospirillum fermentarium TaxID=1233114 RepID=UPI002225F104|nr:DUF2934 domain-containing protein [Azospirillum fermentarium]MCW2248048.1 flagellar biosynthesis regulator FlaF [Azospirillum fermentarium]
MSKRKTTAAAVEATTVAAPDAKSVIDAGADAILKTGFTRPEGDARTLTHAATLLIEANSPETVSIALDHNLKIWVAIKLLVQDDASPLPVEVKENLKNLAQYVSATTMQVTEGTIEESKLVSLARLNMHIAEGLLSGEQNRLIQERAYQIWEAQGRPEGRAMDHWIQAEEEIRAELADK